MWTEFSSSVPHFLHMGSLHNPMICKCLLKVLWPVSRPITILDCVLLKDNNRTSIAGSGPEINSRACLCVEHGSKPPSSNRQGILYFHGIEYFNSVLKKKPLRDTILESVEPRQFSNSIRSRLIFSF
jgi:hypothetical protein